MSHNIEHSVIYICIQVAVKFSWHRLIWLGSWSNVRTPEVAVAFDRPFILSSQAVTNGSGTFGLILHEQGVEESELVKESCTFIWVDTVIPNT